MVAYSFKKQFREPILAGSKRQTIRADSASVKVIHTLRPFAVVMAGSGEFDPFKD
jgi:hypothetical protein